MQPIDQITDPWQGYSFLTISLFSSRYSMHSLMLSSFFFTNNTGASHGDALGLIIPSPNNFYNWATNFFISTGASRYGAFETGAVLGANSISTLFLYRVVTLGDLFGNTSSNSLMTGIFRILGASRFVSIKVAKQVSSSWRSNVSSSKIWILTSFLSQSIRVSYSIFFIPIPFPIVLNTSLFWIRIRWNKPWQFP